MPHILRSKCRLFHNATFFGSCIIHILYTGVLKLKRKFRRQRVNGQAMARINIEYCLCTAELQTNRPHLKPSDVRNTANEDSYSRTHRSSTRTCVGHLTLGGNGTPRTSQTVRTGGVGRRRRKATRMVGGCSREETKKLLLCWKVRSLCPLVLLMVGRRQGEALASKGNNVTGG